MPKLIDLSGQRFGRLTVIERAGTTSNGEPTWRCLCDCGSITVVRRCNLKNGNTKSCGCHISQAVSEAQRTHGQTNTRLYHTWCNMKQRCYNKNHVYYKRYGGRGIAVCDEWLHSFEAFYEWSMNNGYTDKLSIDRIDNDGNYCPENCRWATAMEQRHNRSDTQKRSS